MPEGRVTQISAMLVLMPIFEGTWSRRRKDAGRRGARRVVRIHHLPLTGRNELPRDERWRAAGVQAAPCPEDQRWYTTGALNQVHKPQPPPRREKANGDRPDFTGP